MIEVLVAMMLASIVLATSLSGFFALSREVILIKRHAREFHSVIKAQLLLKRLIHSAGFAICAPGLIRNLLPIELLPKPLPTLQKPGRGKYQSGSILAINSTDRATLLTLKINDQTVLTQNRLHLKKGQAVLISNCRNVQFNSIARVGVQQGQGKLLFAQTLPSQLDFYASIARVRQRVIYHCQAGLCMRATNQRRYVLVKGIDYFHVEPKGRGYRVSIGRGSYQIAYEASR